MAKLSFYKESGAVTQAPTNGVHNAFVYKKDASGNVVGWLSDTGGTYHPITISKLDWSVTNMVNQPTTLSGYGITDAYTINEVDNITGDLGNLTTNNTNNLVAAINELNSAVADGMKPPNPIDCSSNPPYPAANAGETWKVTVGGKVGGANGEIVTPGDLIIAMNGSPGGSQATAGGDFFIVNTNIDSATEAVEGTGRIATTQEVATGNNDFAWVTPLKLDGVLDSYYTKSYLQGKDFWSITNGDIANWNGKAELSDIKNATISFKINGTTVSGNFTTNQGTDETIDLGTTADTHLSDEEVQDIIGGILSSDFIYNDANPGISIDTTKIATRSWVTGKGYLTTETDPEFNASPAGGITNGDIANWNGKAGLTDINDSTIKFKINGVVVTDDFTLNQGTNETIDLGKPYTDEEAQDAVGTILDSTLTYSDGTPSIGVNTSVIASKSWANSQFLTTETDPTVPSHVKNITTGDISDWNAKAELSDIKDGTLTLATGSGLTVSNIFRANQGTNTTFTVGLSVTTQNSLALADSALQVESDTLDSVVERNGVTDKAITINSIDPNSRFQKVIEPNVSGGYSRIAFDITD